MPKVELLWWEGCPSTARALATLRDVLAEEGLDPDCVVQREVDTDGEAEREGFVGSPTIRIGGVEVAPVEDEPAGLTCRVYRLRDGRTSPAPDPEDIRDVIKATAST
ncbi:MAG: thioredoxin family protein [Acidimicrobiia bacterium]|nr:thioredoxin family protein [Acidimicrobiia bacterium]